MKVNDTEQRLQLAQHISKYCEPLPKGICREFADALFDFWNNDANGCLLTTTQLSLSIQPKLLVSGIDIPEVAIRFAVNCGFDGLVESGRCERIHIN